MAIERTIWGKMAYVLGKAIANALLRAGQATGIYLPQAAEGSDTAAYAYLDKNGCTFDDISNCPKTVVRKASHKKNNDYHNRLENTAMIAGTAGFVEGLLKASYHLYKESQHTHVNSERYLCMPIYMIPTGFNITVFTAVLLNIPGFYFEFFESMKTYYADPLPSDCTATMAQQWCDAIYYPDYPAALASAYDSVDLYQIIVIIVGCLVGVCASISIATHEATQTQKLKYALQSFFLTNYKYEDRFEELGEPLAPAVAPQEAPEAPEAPEERRSSLTKSAAQGGAG